MTARGIGVNVTEEDREYLENLCKFLKSHSAFDDDLPGKAAAAFSRFLNGEAKTLDKAFGLQPDGRKTKPLDDGRHADWVLDAALDLILAMQANRGGRSETQITAEIALKHGLGKTDPGDSAVASELKRILNRYRAVIGKKGAEEIEENRKRRKDKK